MDKWIVLVLKTELLTNLPEQIDGHPVEWIVLKEEENLNFDSLPDCVLFDIDADPHWLKRIFQQLSQSLIVGITENMEVDQVQKAFNLGAADLVQLPLSEGLLVKLIRHTAIEQDYARRIKDLEWEYMESQQHLLEKTTIMQTILDSMSHDSKNIFLNIESLLDQLEDTSISGMLKDSFNELYDHTAAAIGYLEGKKRIFNLLDLVKEIRLGRERSSLEGHPRIRLNHGNRVLLFVECSPLLKNALTNLVENALKYSDDAILIDVQREGYGMYCSISDRGPGIPDNEKDKIFERTYRMDSLKAKEGSGRGLWITKNIIQKEGGILKVENREGGGSVFTLELPVFQLSDFQEQLNFLSDWFNLENTEVNRLAESILTLLQLQGLGDVDDLESIQYANLLDFLRRQRQDENNTDFMRKLLKYKKMNPEGKRILIADDSLHVHYYMAQFLTRAGYQIADFARTGEEAVKYYKAIQPELITMDCTMPVKSGLEAAKEIVEFDKGAKVLFVTGLGDSVQFQSTLQEMFPELHFEIVTKPFKNDILQEKIHTLLGSLQ
jgi:signal transduction histidine kinase/CheY-like chemotaxis protein